MPSRQCPYLNNVMEFNFTNMECPDIDKFQLQSGGHMNFHSLKFGLIVDSCRELADNPDTECEKQDDINEALPFICVNFIALSHEQTGDEGTTPQFNNIEVKRRFLQATVNKQRFIQEFFIQKKDVSRSKDWYFGVSFLGSTHETLYEIKSKEQLIDTYESTHDFKALLVARFVQDKQSATVKIIPQNFMMIWTKMGGFLAITLRLVGGIVMYYQNFSFQKSAFKKMYFYSRTKSCKDPDLDNIVPETLNKQALSK